MYSPSVLSDPQFPDEARALFLRLYRQPMAPRFVVAKRVEAYLQRLREQARDDEIIDLDTAVKLGSSVKALLEHTARDMPWEHKLLIQAAARYFLMEEDVHSDIESLVGFDDDVGVINAVARHVGRDDLVVTLL